MDENYITCSTCGCAVEDSLYGANIHHAWHDKIDTLLAAQAVAK